MEYYGNNDYRDYYLAHHGILGMKWGKKNGPPYPLGASDHSASEKKAGWRQSLASHVEGVKNRITHKYNKARIKKLTGMINETQDEIKGYNKTLTQRQKEGNYLHNKETDRLRGERDNLNETERGLRDSLAKKVQTQYAKDKPDLVDSKTGKTVKWDKAFGKDFSELSDKDKAALNGLIRGEDGKYKFKDSVYSDEVKAINKQVREEEKAEKARLAEEAANHKTFSERMAERKQNAQLEKARAAKAAKAAKEAKQQAKEEAEKKMWETLDKWNNRVSKVNTYAKTGLDLYDNYSKLKNKVKEAQDKRSDANYTKLSEVYSKQLLNEYSGKKVSDLTPEDYKKLNSGVQFIQNLQKTEKNAGKLARVPMSTAEKLINKVTDIGGSSRKSAAKESKRNTKKSEETSGNFNQDLKKARREAVRESTTITESERQSMRRAMDSTFSTEPKGVTTSGVKKGKVAVERSMSSKADIGSYKVDTATQDEYFRSAVDTGSKAVDDIIKKYHK